MERLFYESLLPLVFFAPDGAGGGGGAPGGNTLEAWIARLDKADKKDRKALVEDMAKALGVKVGDAYKKLKEAGWDPKAEPQAVPEGAGLAGRLVPVTLRHKSPHAHYRRAGLLLAKTARPFEVTKEQLAVLANDPWVELVGL
jgi:hypothetical protein